jgi:hypothetical protein
VAPCRRIVSSIVLSVSDDPPREKKHPESGWTLGAGGLPRPVWGALAGLLVILGVVLLFGGYIGYGAIIVILALAAAVNVK